MGLFHCPFVLLLLAPGFLCDLFLCSSCDLASIGRCDVGGHYIYIETD